METTVKNQDIKLNRPFEWPKVMELSPIKFDLHGDGGLFFMAPFSLEIEGNRSIARDQVTIVLTKFIACIIVFFIGFYRVFVVDIIVISIFTYFFPNETDLLDQKYRMDVNAIYSWI